MFKSSRTLMLVALFPLGLAACSDDGSTQDSQQSLDIVQTAQAAGTFGTLVGALQATGLDTALKGPGPFTVFAPTDQAFARLPAGVIASLTSEQLTSILKYHVVSGAVPSSTAATLSSASTLEGSSFALSTDGSTLVINGVVQVVQKDIAASNGIIHVVDAVILPAGMTFPGTITDAVVAYPRFSALKDAVVAAGLADTLAGDNGGAGYTVFAPTNSAFAALGGAVASLSMSQLTGILLYHVVPGTVTSAEVVGLTSATTAQGSSIAISVVGGKVKLNGSVTVTWTDVRASNGIIHVIDGVLMPMP